MGMPEPATFQFASEMEQDGCEAPLSEWRHRSCRPAFNALVMLAIGIGGRDDQKGNDE